VVMMTAALVLMHGLPASAQDLSLGYQFQWNDSVNKTRTYPFGFDVDASFPFTADGALAGFGQFDWSRRGENETQFSSNLTFYGAGVRWTISTSSRLRPYFQFAVGASRLSIPDEDAAFDATTDVAFQLGAGVAGALSSRLEWIAQLDYRPVLTEDEGSHGIRLLGGIRIPFKQ
jgi:hypothetical protein